MLYYLHLLANQFDALSFFRVFQYITVRAFAAAGTAFLFSLILGPPIIKKLSSMIAGEHTRYKEDIPTLDAIHGEAKKKTPTMGGIIIVLSLTISTLLWAIPTNPLVWLAVASLLSMSALGFVDDYRKAVLKNPRGVSGKAKLFWQGVFVLCLIVALLYIPATAPHTRSVMVPMLKTPIFSNICFVCLFVFLFLVFAGSSNAVNLTDGLDGLAAGCTASVAFAFQIMTYVAGHSKLAAYLQIPYISGAGELSIFCAALLGASLGFLWFNCYPAQVFMGDTGSLAIGGAIATVAIIIKQEIILFVVGGIFVMEAASVILQVASFKLRKQRIFACSPLHHHFELKKNPWSENQVVVRFWILSIIFALMGVLFLKIR